MKAVKFNDAICIYLDEALPVIYTDTAISFDAYPEKPDGEAHLDIVNGELVWVTVEVEPTTDELMGILLGVSE